MNNNNLNTNEDLINKKNFSNDFNEYEMMNIYPPDEIGNVNLN